MPFDPFDFVRGFFGYRNDAARDYREDFWGDSQNSTNDFTDFTNESLQMHRYFESQFNDIFRIFESNIFDRPHLGEFNMFENNERLPAQKNIRDEYLKPGFQTEFHKDNNKDSDLDGLIAPQDVDSFMNNNNHNNQRSDVTSIVPMNPNPNFFGRVVITKTIIKPDGTQETHRTVRDSRTNQEETTVTIVQGDNPSRDHSEKTLWDNFFKNK